ncbi:MAG: hypothetical protein KF866_02085 [Phycisphaeraceae bacterium]|nr:hypothetical protein [Phycisphaeraceae bacterium]
MTQSYTKTSTFTASDARRVGGKVAADLRQMQMAYGSPTDQEIDDYLGELVSLLSDGYLDTVMYGFKKDGTWLSATLRYTALSLGTTGESDRSGTVKRGVETAGAYFTSFLTYSPKWWNLSEEARARYKAGLPIQRVSGEEPKAPGGWIEDKSYISGGGGVRRAVLGGVS